MFINLLPSVIISKGTSFAAIFDMEEGVYASIPLSWGDFLDTKNRSFEVIYPYILQNENGVCSEDFDLINFLISNCFAIESRYIIPFEKIETDKWDIPFIYETLLVDSSSEENLFRYIDALPNYRISRFSQFRLFFSATYKCLKRLLLAIENKGYYNTDIVTNYKQGIAASNYHQLLTEHPYHLSKLIIMDYHIYIDGANPRLIFNSERMDDCSMCGIIEEALYSINIDTYLKYSKGNTCLWKKISISADGQIRNCPSMPISYGHISNTNILGIKSNPTYKYLSEIKKSEIDVCRDCEFRVFCTDCRANICNPNNIYSKPKKCKYNLSQNL